MRTRLVTFGLLALVAAMAALAVACGGDDEGTPSGSGGQNGGNGGQTSQGPTKLPAVDHLIQAARDVNVIELAAQSGYQKVRCESGGGANGPACREGESSGTEVEALAFSNCDRAWVRPEQVPDTYRMVLSSGKVSLYAAYEPSDTSNTFEGGFGSTHVVVLAAGARNDGQPAGVALHVRNGRITIIEKECNGIADLVSSSRVKTMIVAPEGGAATPAP